MARAGRAGQIYGFPFLSRLGQVPGLVLVLLTMAQTSSGTACARLLFVVGVLGIALCSLLFQKLLVGSPREDQAACSASGWVLSLLTLAHVNSKDLSFYRLSASFLIRGIVG